MSWVEIIDHLWGERCDGGPDNCHNTVYALRHRHCIALLRLGMWIESRPCVGLRAVALAMPDSRD